MVLFSPSNLASCCLVCNARRSVFSIMLKSMQRTEARDIVGLKFSRMNWLNSVNGMSGNCISSDNAEAVGTKNSTISVHRNGGA